jgi:SAM-dependent methyltransferase
MFPTRIRSIGSGAKVLDIGPGNSPHPRADILLEKRFSPVEAYEQRGKTPELVTDKPIVFFDDHNFPFRDKEFDYVICSHVLEHVPDVKQFVAEIFRVAKAGYFEFPSIYYEYIYNFPVHLQLLSYTGSELRFMPKNKSKLDHFKSVQKLFYRSLELDYYQNVNDLKHIMFVGFEWSTPFPVREVDNIDELTSDSALITRPSLLKRCLRRLQHKLNL